METEIKKPVNVLRLTIGGKSDLTNVCEALMSCLNLDLERLATMELMIDMSSGPTVIVLRGPRCPVIEAPPPPPKPSPKPLSPDARGGERAQSRLKAAQGHIQSLFNAGLSLRDISIRSAVGYSTLCSWKGGMTFPRSETLLRRLLDTKPCRNGDGHHPGPQVLTETGRIITQTRDAAIKQDFSSSPQITKTNIALFLRLSEELLEWVMFCAPGENRVLEDRMSILEASAFRQRLGFWRSQPSILVQWLRSPKEEQERITSLTAKEDPAQPQ